MGLFGISGNTWKKVGKYALKAAPIIAAPFTGGTSLLALGAGAGALSGALDGGGWKGALIGGGLGAIPGGGVGGAAGGGVAKLGAKQLATNLAKGAATNFATGTGTGLATGQGVKRSLAGGGSSALSGFGTQGGAGGFGQAAKTVGKGVALNVGGQAASRGLQAAGVPGGIAGQGGNVFSNYLGNQFTSPSSSGNDWNFMPGGQSQPPAAGINWRGLAGGALTGIGGAFTNGGGGAQGGGPPARNAMPTGGGTPVQWGSGGDTSQAPADPNAPKPASWQERWGPIIAQGAGVAAGALIGRQAQKNAAKRSPEEQAALSGAQRGAGDLSRLGGQLAQQGQDYSQKPGQYFQTLLGGNRAAMSQAVAAPTAALTDTYRGAERNLQQQGIRGAARDVAAGDLNRDRASKIAALTTGVQPYAAEQLAGMGRDSTAGAVAALGAGGNLYGNLLGQGYNNRVYSRKEGGDTAAAIGGLARDMGEVVFKKGPGGAPKPKPAKKPYAQDTANRPPAPIGTPGDFDPNKQYPQNG